jgi:hypothetical protein
MSAPKNYLPLGLVRPLRRGQTEARHPGDMLLAGTV